MRALSLLLLLALLAAAAATADTPADDLEGWKTTCRDAVGKLGKALKTELSAAMKPDGAVGALQACNVEAVPIAQTISTEEGLIVGRTSLKTRNPANAPDDWEIGVLTSFEVRKKAGEKAADLESWTVATDDAGHRTFRYMKAVPTMPMCLQCHGRRLSDEVAAKVAELYPEDQATGFVAGDIRGAFTVRLPID